MKITRKYIMDNRTDRGAWTRPQIEALGIEWPPRKGWIERVSGKELSRDNQIQFESKIGIKKVRRLQKKGSFGNRVFEDRKAKALEKYQERKAVEDVDRKTVADLKRWI